MNIPIFKNLTGITSTEKYIKSHYNEFYQYILNNYPEELTWSEKLYWCYHNINAHPTCPICGKQLKYYSFQRGYHKYCSNKCEHNDPKKKSKTKQTCLERYGVENPFQSKVVQDKYKQTCLDKYNVVNPMKSIGIQDRYKQTCLDKYNVVNPMKSIDIQERVKQTNLEKYDVEYPLQSDIIKDKSNQTCLKKYGVEHYSQSEEYRSRYDEIQNKSKQTCLERYGVENPFQSQEVRNKVKQTCLERYGVENYNQSEEGKSRLSNILSSEEVQTKINNTKHQNHTFNSSEIESLFSKYLDSQNIEYKRQYRSKEYPFNCDFYLPKYDLYIEIQASWTHGGHPFNIEVDKDILEKWKSKNTDYYNNAIETWTERDIKKREIAKQNQLNYLEIFSNNIDFIIKDLKAFGFSI
jgi:G:T-mismatch repair DNA endonuclease (very short patch repair protein)/predicted nucleic acid-binding Zn ribbon protein